MDKLPAKGPGGRPLELTREVQDLICQAIREGNYREVAAEWAGVKVRTIQHWSTLGRRNPDSIYGEFLRAVLEAERAAEMKMVEQVFKAATQDPNHAKWWLERKFPDRWGGNRLELLLLKKQMAELQKQVTDAASHIRTGAPKSADQSGTGNPQLRVHDKKSVK